jgi:hypothetical protein
MGFKKNICALVVTSALGTQIMIRKVGGMVASANDGGAQASIASVTAMIEGKLLSNIFCSNLLILCSVIRNTTHAVTQYKIRTQVVVPWYWSAQ